MSARCNPLPLPRFRPFPAILPGDLDLHPRASPLFLPVLTHKARELRGLSPAAVPASARLQPLPLPRFRPFPAVLPGGPHLHPRASPLFLPVLAQKVVLPRHPAPRPLADGRGTVSPPAPAAGSGRLGRFRRLYVPAPSHRVVHPPGSPRAPVALAAPASPPAQARTLAEPVGALRAWRRILPLLLAVALSAAGATHAAERSPLERCREALSREQSPLYKLPTPAPVHYALGRIAEGCHDALPQLAAAARRARRQSRAERAVTLGAAAAPLLPPESALPGPQGSALEASLLGRLPPLLDVGERSLEPLDAGTYLYLVALAGALGPLGEDGPHTVTRFFRITLIALGSEAASAPMRARGGTAR